MCALILQARLLSAEHLEGENKYHCAFCESKVDATRQIRLHCVPPVLCLSLQRFVFDMKVRHAAWCTEALQMIRDIVLLLLGHILLAAEDSLVAMHLDIPSLLSLPGWCVRGGHVLITVSELSPAAGLSTPGVSLKSALITVMWLSVLEPSLSYAPDL